MKNAWRHYRAMFVPCTFAEALRWAWAVAKRERQYEEQSIRRWAEHKQQFGKMDAEINRAYKNVVFGRNDYRVSYGYRSYARF